jgi:DNA-binding transcriptional LysR family regulator
VSLAQLRYFVAVAEELHFGRAAERLRMSQPPLSRQIQRLEEELGVTLLVRAGHRVELAPAGAALLERARSILSRVERVRDDVTAADRRVSRIRLLAPPGIDEGVVVKAARMLRDGTASSALQVIHGLAGSKDVATALEDALVDAAIIRVEAHEAVRGSVVARELATEVPCLAVAAADRSPAPETLAAAFAKGRPVVRLCGESEPVARAIVDGLLSRSAHREIIEVTSLGSLYAFVREGLGVGVLVAPRLSAPEGVRLVPLSDAAPRTRLLLIERHDGDDVTG